MSGLRLALLTALTMMAFAANSVLNRLAVDMAGMAPGVFAALRVAAGAVTLALLSWSRGAGIPTVGAGRLRGAAWLSLYMIGFSAAYRTLDAGLGALILFGVVQITIFAVAALQGGSARPRQLAGAGLAFAGLAWVLWPAGTAAADPLGGLWMVAAGIGWGLYTLAGRDEPDPLAATAANFALALPVTLLAALPAGGGGIVTPAGAGLAILSGAVTSGLGYALWYALLPRIAAATTAVVQLSVPLIAMAAGAILLRESLPPRLILGAALVLGGILLALGAGRSRG